MKSIEHNTPILLTNVKKNMAQRLSLNALQGNVSCPENEYLLMIAYLYQTSNRELCFHGCATTMSIYLLSQHSQTNTEREETKKTQVHLSLPSVFGVTVQRR